MAEAPSIAVAADGLWVAVPVNGETPSEYGPAVVAELGEAVPADSREPLAQDLTMFAGRARDSGAIFAAVMLADDADTVLAYTECRPFDATAADLPADTQRLADALDATTIEPPGWQRITTADLPAGPAVRVHILDAGHGQDGLAEDLLPVVESVTHLVPETTAGPGVALVTTWPALLAADELVAEADRLAATLAIMK